MIFWLMGRLNLLQPIVKKYSERNLTCDDSKRPPSFITVKFLDGYIISELEIY